MKIQNKILKLNKKKITLFIALEQKGVYCHIKYFIL